MKLNDQCIQASVLDRLVDHNPGVSHEPVQYRLLNLGQIKVAVRRDLENLLNTRRRICEPGPAFQKANNSFLVYGLEDFTTYNPRSPSVVQKLRHDIEKTLLRFETRLRNVIVHIDPPTQTDHFLKIRITGLLVAGQVSEPVSFDTYFDVNRSEYRISK